VLSLHEHPPARYCTGYLGGVGMPPPHAAGTFAGWFAKPEAASTNERSSRSRCGSHDSMHHDRLMLILHERGTHIRLADRKRFSPSLRGRNRRRLKQRYQSQYIRRQGERPPGYGG
jgi:hypothetical protein